MAEAAQEEPETTDDEQQQEYPWANITPTTRLRGNVVEIFTPQQISGEDAQTDSSYGIVIENPDVVTGNVYVNDARDGGLARDEIDEDSSNPTDYRIADPDDQSVTVVGDTLVTDEESTVDGEAANEYTLGDFEDDTILLWVSGLAGERIIRHLDFNGRPYAKFTENGPVYGLFQAHDEWFEQGANRGELAGDGKAPRLTRPPIMRPDVSDVLINITADDGGQYRSYRGHVFDADAFSDEFGDVTTPVSELPTGQYGLDTESELDLRMADYDEADEIIAEQDWDFAEMFHEGEGWGQIPEEYQSSSNGGGGGMTVNTDTSDDSDADVEQDSVAVETIVEAMEGDSDAHGLKPDEFLQNGVSGFVESNADEWNEPPTGERLEDIRAEIYNQLAWLDAEELDE